MRILLVLSIVLIAVSGYKTFAHDDSDVISFIATKNSYPVGGLRVLFSVLKTELSQDMVQLVDSINSVNNFREVEEQIISFDAIGVDGKIHDNIQCSLEFFYKQIGDCHHTVISFLDCGNNEVVFQNKRILIFYHRISAPKNIFKEHTHPHPPVKKDSSCSVPLKVEE